MMNGQQNAPEAATEGQPATAFHLTHSAHNRIAEAAARAEHLADKLCGPVPQPAAEKAAPPQNASLFSALTESSAGAYRDADRIHMALSRIEKELP